ncbi:MAG: hypothetical protein AAF632_18710 [Bacteroidota bacterium]
MDILRIKKRRVTFGKINPIFALENDKTVFKDGRVGVGFKIQNAEMETWSSDQYESFNTALARFVTTLPPDTSVQKSDFYYYSNNTVYDNPQEYFELMTNRFFYHSLQLRQSSYIFITVPPKGGKSRGRVTPFSTLLNATKSMLGNVFAKIPKTLFICEEIGNKFSAKMDEFNGVRFSRLRETELAYLYSQYYNLDFKESHQEGKLAEMNIDPTGMQHGHNQLRIVSLTGRGSEIHHSMKNAEGVSDSFSHRLGLPMQIPHVTTTSFRVLNNQKELTYLDRQKFFNRSFTWGAFSSQSNEIAERNLDEFTALIRDTDAKIVTLSQNVMLYELNQEILRYYIDQADSSFSTMDGCKAVQESCDTLALYLANVPGNGFNNYRTLLMDNHRAVPFLQFMGRTNTHNKGDVLCDRFRNPLRVDFSNRTWLTNQNVIVVGPTGSGKSYTVGEFIIQRKERGCRQVILDVGGTYRNIMTLLNGKDFKDTYFETTSNSSMSYAPFAIPKKRDGQYDLDNNRLDFLTSLLTTIWKGSKHVHEIRQSEKTVLQDLLESYYYDINKKKKQASFSGFYQFADQCRKQAEQDPIIKRSFTYFDIDEFLLVLKPFHDGAYKHLLNADKVQDLSSYNLICFDLQGVFKNKILSPIVSQLVIQLVLDQLEQFPDDEKFFYMDEAWTMLDGVLGDFMEATFRTIRKQKGAIWIITQSYNDIVKSPHHVAITSNAATRIILRHDEEELRGKTSDQLGFSAHYRDMFASLRKGDGYRDILVKMMNHVTVYTMEVPPEHNAILSSNPEERNLFIQLLDKHQGDHHTALEEFTTIKKSAA